MKQSWVLWSATTVATQTSDTLPVVTIIHSVSVSQHFQHFSILACNKIKYFRCSMWKCMNAYFVSWMTYLYYWLIESYDTHTRLTTLCPGLPGWVGTRKVKTNLDFTEARDSEWQWHQLGHMQVCTSLRTDNHASTPPLSFLQAGCLSCRPANSVNALKAYESYEQQINESMMCYLSIKHLSIIH